MKYLSTLLFLSIVIGTAELYAQAPAGGTASGEPAAAGPPEAVAQPAAQEAGATAAADSPEPSPQGENAQDEAPADGAAGASELDKILDSGAIGLLRRGGFFMWPILLMGVIAAGVIIERYRSLKLLAGDSAALRSEVLELLQQDRVEEAHQLCDREQGPVPAILGAGLRKFLVLRRLKYDAARIEEQVVKAMDDYSVHIVAALERHLPILATVSSVAPMLGFLGTVQGMIVSFDNIVARMGEMNIVEAAAGGIGVALLTTCFGLIVGIPAFIAFNYFTSIINRFVLDVEESATDLIETVTLHMAVEEAEEEVPANV